MGPFHLLSVEMTMELHSKPNVARSQIGEAIKLFFERRDPVSIHTLIGAAHQILRDVANANGIPYKCIIEDIPDNGGLTEKAYYREVFRPRNFFKHAGKDSNVILDFDARENELWLLDACCLYGQIFDKPHKPIGTFWAWYQCKYPETKIFLSASELGRLAELLKIDAENYEFYREHCDEDA